MNVAVVGLGIIGGSLAKALAKYTDHHIIGINRSPAPLQEALACGAIHEIGTAEDLKRADLIFLGTFPEVAVEFIRTNAHLIPSNCIVADTSGIKSKICPQLFKIAKEHGFVFVGMHPMAGKEKNGFSASDADLFAGASNILVPGDASDEAVRLLTNLSKKLGFGTVRLSTPEEHDRMIAFTSQLPHALACAYVFSPSCPQHKGFSAGSYRDVSRVANINAALWSELFIENQEPLLSEIDILIENLNDIKAAIQKGNREELTALLHRGKEIKEALGE